MGESSPQVGTAYYNIGESLLLQERPAASIEALMRARELWLAIYARDNNRLGMNARLLAEAYRNLGDRDRARSFFEEAVATLTAAESPEHLSLALTGYSRFLAEDNARDAAILHGKRAVNIVQQMRGDARNLEPELRRSLVRKREEMYRQLAGC